MIIPSESHAIKQGGELLCQWLECDSSEIRFSEPDAAIFNNLEGRPDAIMSLKHVTFIVEYKRSGKVGSVAEAIDFLRGAETDQPNKIKLLIVPYMWKLGAKRCREADISWLDLSGNADIIGPDTRIYVDGRPNKFRQPGRPPNPFASKSSRVARALLYNPGSSFIQRDLSRKTDLDEGYVSKIVSELERLRLIDRTGDGIVAMKDPVLLLEAWEESYSFSKHNILRGHIPARSGEALLYSLGEFFSGEMVKHAATGLAAAWLHTHFVAFRTVTFFVDESVNAGMLSNINFSEIEAGSNTWLVIPSDESVYWGLKEIDGVQCVHPIQAYLDLMEHPERSEEAASQMHRLILPKSK